MATGRRQFEDELFHQISTNTKITKHACNLLPIDQQAIPSQFCFNGLGPVDDGISVDRLSQLMIPSSNDISPITDFPPTSRQIRITAQDVTDAVSGPPTPRAPAQTHTRPATSLRSTQSLIRH
jgi:hypothetical protein